MWRFTFIMKSRVRYGKNKQGAELACPAPLYVLTDRNRLFSVELEGVVFNLVVLHHYVDEVLHDSLADHLLVVAGCILLVAVGA